MADQLTDYLDREAARVRVEDTLDEIESGVPRVAVVDVRREHRGRAPAFVAAAAAVVGLLAFMGASRHGTSPVAAGAAVGEPVPVTADVPAPAPLPDGATMQGLVPLCTTTDGVEFDCAVDDYRHAGRYDDGGIDHTGESQVIVSGDSVVSGGCRSTSADGSTWHCALGQRAVELGLVGPNFLGEYVPAGYAGG